MHEANSERLRILVVNRGEGHGTRAAARMAVLGHDVVAGEIASIDASAVAAYGWPDLALVDVGAGSIPAFELVERLAGAVAFPVVVVTDDADPAFGREAAARGAFGCVAHEDHDTWEGTIEVAVRRFHDYYRLAAAFERRAVIERAKGVLMERHSVGERDAFEVLRRHARDANRRLVDVAVNILDGHMLLPRA